MIEEAKPRTLYVGNLDLSATEDLVVALFSQIGDCTAAKIIREPGNDPYCFVEFSEHTAAAAALLAMNKRICLGKEMKVNWATTPSTQPLVKTDTSNHYHIFVGDLSPDIDQAQLQTAFLPFGQISDVKIIRDQHSLQSKGYGFVSFVNKNDAENAIQSMNGQWLGSRAIRTNWATRKPPGLAEIQGRRAANFKALDYDDMFHQASSSNTTVYCGGIHDGLTESLMREAFSEFGHVVNIRVFKEAGYSFIKFDNKESACQAIVNMHGQRLGNYVVKCSWGKEEGASSAPGQYTAGYGTAVSSNYGYGSAPASQGQGQPSNPWSNMNQQEYAAYYQQYYQQYYSSMQQQGGGGGSGAGGGPGAGGTYGSSGSSNSNVPNYNYSNYGGGNDGTVAAWGDPPYGGSQSAN